MSIQTKLSLICQNLSATDASDRTEAVRLIEDFLKDPTLTESIYQDLWIEICKSFKRVTGVKTQLEMAIKVSKLMKCVVQIQQNNILCFLTSAMKAISEQYIHNVKFLNLTRYVLKEIHVAFQTLKWDSKVISRLRDSTNLGNLLIQLSVEILLEIQTIPVDTVTQLLEPYFNLAIVAKNAKLMEQIRDSVFYFFLANIKTGNFTQANRKKVIDKIKPLIQSKELPPSNKSLFEEILKNYEEADITTSKNKDQNEMSIEQLGNAPPSPRRSARVSSVGSPRNSLTESPKNSSVNRKRTKSEAIAEEKADKKSDKKLQQRLRSPPPKKKEKSPKKKTEKKNTKKKMKKDPVPKKNSPKITKGDMDEELSEQKNDEIEEEVEESEEISGESFEDDDEEEAGSGEYEEGDEGDCVELQGLLGDGTLPEYLFKSPAEQRKYFDKLNKEYKKNLEKSKQMTREHKRTVQFQLHKVSIKEFDKRLKIGHEKTVSLTLEKPKKGILKAATLVPTESKSRKKKVII